MIVRDEAENLPRCLRSLEGAIDELIVVDTGSQDATVRIARDWGAQVLPFRWCDDFAAARNESLRHATSDFVIWIDADNELVESRPGALRRLCQELAPSDWGYYLSEINVRADGDSPVVVDQWRVFRNHLGIRFRGRIHEQLWAPPATLPGRVLPQTEVQVRHWGFDEAPDVLQRKKERNRRLLSLAIAEEPGEPFHYVNLGMQHAFEREFGPAGEALERAADLWAAQGRPALPYVPVMFLISAAAAFELGHYQRVLDIERQTPAQFVSPDVLYYAGLACLRLGRQHDAISRLERARSGSSLSWTGLSDRSRATWRPCLALAQAYDELGQKTEAYAVAEEALEFAPDQPEVLYILGTLAYRLADDRSAAVDWLCRLLAGERDQGFKPKARRLLLEIADAAGDAELGLKALAGEVEGLGGPDLVLAKARAYAESSDVQRQCDVLQAGCEEFPADHRIRLALARLLDGRGLSQAALQVAGAGLDQPDAPAELYQQLGLLLAKEGRMNDAANALTMALQLAQASQGSRRSWAAKDALRIGIFFHGAFPYDDAMLEKQALGGAETAALRMTRALRALGHEVLLEQDPDRLESLVGVDVLIFQRHPLVLEPPIARQTYFWSPDDIHQPFWAPVRGDATYRDRLVASVTKILAVSRYHAARIESLGIPGDKIRVTRNGIDLELFKNGSEIDEQRPLRCVYATVPSRGLDILLDVWPEIRRQVPDAELQVFSSMKVYGPEAAKEDAQYEPLYDRARTLPGVEYFGSVPQPRLAQALRDSRLLLYPATVAETSCIHALEAQAAGCVVVTSDLGALPETASGNRIIPGEPGSPEYRAQFVDSAVELLRDRQLWVSLSRQNRQRMQSYTWEAVAAEWVSEIRQCA